MSENYQTKAQAICGDAEAVRKLLVEIHELKRTRSEAEASAYARGHRAGIEETKRQLRGIGVNMTTLTPPAA